MAGSALAMNRTGGDSAHATARASNAPKPPSFEPRNPRRLTFDEGCQEFPSFTPDGKHVVFDATRGSTSAIMIADLDGRARPLTKPTLWDFAANISPNGELIAFLRASRDGAVGTWTARLDGTSEPEFLASGQVRPSFTPDGSAVWAGEHDHPSRFDLGTRRATRRVDSPSGAVAPMGREVPDGRYLVVFPQGNGAAASGLAAFAKDGSLSWLSHDHLNEVLAVLPGESVVISARQTETNNVELLAIPLDGRPPTPLPTRDVLPTEGLAFSHDGKNVTWSTCHTLAGLVYVTDDGAFTPVHDPVEWDESAAAPIPGTHRLVAVSARSGPSSLWVLDQGTGEARELSARVHGSPSQLAVSPDGRFVAVQLGAGLSLVPVDGGAPRLLTNEATDGSPAFRRDGRELLFTRTSTTDGALRVHAIDIAGAAVRPLLARGTSSPATCSHDDRIAYLAGEDHSKVVPMITAPDPANEQPRQLSPDLGAGSYRSLARSPDGIHVALLEGPNTVVVVNLVTGVTTKIVDPRAGFLASLVYTDTQLLVARSLFVGNIWLADLPR
jgi:Tol biopolymer transport system component